MSTHHVLVTWVAEVKKKSLSQPSVAFKRRVRKEMSFDVVDRLYKEIWMVMARLNTSWIWLSCLHWINWCNSQTHWNCWLGGGEKPICAEIFDERLGVKRYWLYCRDVVQCYRAVSLHGFGRNARSSSTIGEEGKYLWWQSLETKWSCRGKWRWAYENSGVQIGKSLSKDQKEVSGSRRMIFAGQSISVARIMLNDTVRNGQSMILTRTKIRRSSIWGKKCHNCAYTSNVVLQLLLMKRIPQ